MHRELLRLATTLAADNAGSPRWVSRHRAVSTAYYALFHALAEMCARELVGAGQPWKPYRHIYRSLEHGHAKRVLHLASQEAGISDDAKLVAEAFVGLQKERHGADYDPGYRISSSDLRALLSQARSAVELILRIPPAERKLLAARLIGRTRA